MEDIALYIYTHTDCQDVWQACFSRINKYGSKFENKYVFINKNCDDIPKDFKQLIYDDNKLFSEKVLHCLRQIKEKYIIYTHEDFILYDYVNFEKIIEYKNILDNNNDNIKQIQLIRAGMPALNKPGFDFQKLIQYRDFNDLYILPNNCKQYNGQTTLWHKDSAIKVYENNIYGNSSHILKNKIIIDMENPVTHKWLVDNNVNGLFHYTNGTTLRGLSWDSTVYPYISTAIRKGKWDLRHGKKESILNCLKEFYIDINKRGYII